MQRLRICTLAILATAAWADPIYSRCQPGPVATLANTSCTIGNALFTFGSAQTENDINGEPFTGSIVVPDLGFTGPVTISAITPETIGFTPVVDDPWNFGFSLDAGNFSLFSSLTTSMLERLDWTVSIRVLDPSRQIANLTGELGYLNSDAAVVSYGWGDGAIFALGRQRTISPVSPTVALSDLPISLGGDASGGGGFISDGDFKYQINEVPEPKALFLLTTTLIACFRHGRRTD